MGRKSVSILVAVLVARAAAAGSGPPDADRPATAAAAGGPGVSPAMPPGWVLIDDALYGSRVAVPPGWTPRIRGDAALCVEPDAVPRAGAFFVPLRLKGKARPEDVADGFDEMLRRAVPSLRTREVSRPTGDSIQRDLAAAIGDVPIAGSYRAIVGRRGTAFVMGHLAPRDAAEKLRPDFYRILASYRYTGPRSRLKPFRSPGVELLIPDGWQVGTSEGSGTAREDIDWTVSSAAVPGARAFMTTLKFFTPNWVADPFTGQIDGGALSLWRNKGFQMANVPSDDEGLRAALAQVMPGLEVVRRQSMDEVRDAFAKMYDTAIQTARGSGGRFTLYAYEFLGKRRAGGEELRSALHVGMAALVVPAGIKGNCGMWFVNVRGFEAPAPRFPEVAALLDRVDGSFNYTLWWIREVQKANEEQARTLRKLYADMRRIDREIWDSRVRTRSAIAEMMYDTLTDNYGYLNEKTGSIEKIPADQIERFRKEGGDIVSPEDVIERKVPVREATVLREASADDYMSFDRRVQVWP